jgi:hypothetical protein
MRKTETEPENYELLTQGSGCVIASIFIIVGIVITLIAWSFV